MKNAWARVRTGPVHLECPSELAAGERLAVRVHLPRGARARIAEVEVRLAAFKLDGVGSTTVAPFSTYRARNASLRILDARPDPGFADGTTDAWTAALDVPLDAPPSLHTSGPSLCWRVEARCRSRFAPEHLVAKPILLRPPRAGAAP